MDNQKDQLLQIDYRLRPNNSRYLPFPFPKRKTSQEGFEGLTTNGSQIYALLESHGNDSAIIAHNLQNGVSTFYNLKLGKHQFKDPESKGFEGVSIIESDGTKYLFALCEGNKCQQSKKTNKGRILVFQKVGNGWVKQKKPVKLDIPFKDFSGLSITPIGRIAITSQENSQLWVGQLHFKKGKWKVKEKGIYNFPRAKKVSCNGKTFKVKGKDPIIYQNVEGVAWLDENTLVTVTDRRKNYKKKKARPYQCKDQSIQIVRLP